MSFRINTNTQAALALTSLNKTTDGIGSRQLRLATGSRINSAADDSAGFTISNKLTAKTRGQAQALSNIGDAKSMLTVAEGSLGTTMDILQTMKEKAVQAGNSSMGTEERAAIQSQVDALTAEVSDILSGAEFNGTKLFSDTESTSLSFQVGDASGNTFGATVNQMGAGTLGLTATVAVTAEDAVEAEDAVDASASASAGTGTGEAFEGVLTVDGAGYTGTEDADYTFSVVDNAGTLELQDADGNAVTVTGDYSGDTTFSIDGIDVTIDGATYDLAEGDSFTISAVAAKDAVEAQDAVEGVEVGDVVLDLTTDEGVAAALTTIDAAIASVNSTASKLGDVQNRLDFKAQNLETSMNNYDAANSRIADADFAKEQMEIVKLQILQQTGSAMFAQSNAAPQSVLSFF